MSVSFRTVTCTSCKTKNQIPDQGYGRPQCGSCRRPLRWVVDANDITYLNLVESDLIVLVELYATWSKPSGMVSPIVDRISVDYAGRLKVVRVNADECPGVQRSQSMTKPPTLVILKNGRAMNSIVGAQPEAIVRRQLDEFLV